MSRFSIAKAVVVALAACSVQANATAINLVANGSFETVDPNAKTIAYKFYNPKTYAEIAGSTKFGIWSTSAISGWNSLYGNQMEIDINGVGQVDTAFGSNYLELDTHFGVTTDNQNTTNESNAGLSQNLSGLTVGSIYELTFWYRARSVLADDNLLNVYWMPTSVASGLNQQLKASQIMPLIQGYVVKTIDYSAQDNNNAGWVQYTQKFMATSTNMTLGFGAAGDAKWKTTAPAYQNVVSYNGNKDGAQLDNVSLYSVPTPATLGLLGLGVAGLMLRRRRA
jgi:hypothetical protein